MRGQSLNYLFKDRNAKTRVRVKELMAGSNRDVWRCDPDTLSGMHLFLFKKID